MIEKSLMLDSFTIEYITSKNINMSIENVIIKNVFISHRVFKFNRKIYNEINEKRKFKNK